MNSPSHTPGAAHPSCFWGQPTEEGSAHPMKSGLTTTRKTDRCRVTGRERGEKSEQIIGRIPHRLANLAVSVYVSRSSLKSETPAQTEVPAITVRCFHSGVASGTFQASEVPARPGSFSWFLSCASGRQPQDGERGSVQTAREGMPFPSLPLLPSNPCGTF
jgi:hypothetical protein